MTLKRMAVLFLTGFLAAFMLPKARAGENFDKQDFRRCVKREMTRWHVPGAAVLLIKDGRVIFSEGFGYRDLDGKLPVTSATLFPIASCTKTFTPFTVGMLVDEGKLSWDRPIRDYYPGLKLYDDYATEHLTLRDVLCHRSGLPRHDHVWIHAGLSRDDLMSRLRYLQPSREVREVFQYNNIAYSIAGVVVEKVTGVRWEDFVKARVFGPLGMVDSTLTLDALLKTENHALPYALAEEDSDAGRGAVSGGAARRIPFQAYNTTGPASCINSNLDDMAKWVMLQLDGGRVGDARLVSPETFKEIHSPQMAIPTEGEFKPFVCAATPMISYGLGWVVQPFLGRMMLDHSGGVDGFSSIVAYLPNERAGVVVLTNMQTNMVPYVVAFNYFDRILGGEQVDRGQALKESLDALLAEMRGGSKAADETGRPPTHALKDYAGEYSHPAYGTVTVTEESGGLYASYRGVKAPALHRLYDSFEATIPYPAGPLTLRMNFFLDGEGEVDGFTSPLQPGVDEIRFDRPSAGTPASAGIKRT